MNRIIDFHTHTFPDKIAASTVEMLAQKSHTRPFSDGTAGGLSARARAAGVTLSIVLPVATNPRQVAHINDFAARTNEHTEQTGLLSFGCIHPDCPEWKAELDRIAALGLKGVKLHPVYQDVDFDDPRYLNILSRAGELGLIVITHAGADIGYPGVERCTPEMILRAIRQTGPVKLVLAHMGGWREWDRAEELLADQPVWLDTAFSTGSITPLDDGYYRPEELPMLQEADFLHMVRTFGADRLLFGTDSPWSDQRESIDWMNALPLPEADKNAILGGNAARLLEIDA